MRTAFEIPATTRHRLVALWIVALLALGGWLRMHGVDDYYYSLDELAHVEISKGTSVGQVVEFSKYETHPPYAQILRHYWIMINDAPWFVRSESVLFGLLCIVVYYALGKELGGTLSGCTAAYLVTFGFGNIEQSQIVRNYELLALFLGLAFLFYQTYLRTRKTIHLAGYSVALLLALMTHYCAAFALICMGGMGFTRIFLQGRSRRALVLWTIANAALSLYYCYIYITEVRLNAYAPQFALNDQIASESAQYNTVGFRIALFVAYIPATVSYFLHSSYVAQLDSPSVLLFIGAMVWLFSALKHRPLFYETLLSLAFGALLLAADIYPYTFRIGGRHAIWALPYVITPIALFAGFAIPWFLARVQEHLRTDRRIWLAAMAILLGFGVAINPARAFFGDLREYQITNVERREMQSYLATLGAQDVMIIGGLNAMYLLPNGVNYYSELAAAKPGDWYYAAKSGDLRMLLYYPIHDSTFKTRTFISRLKQAGELENVRTVWFFNTLYNTVLLDSPECEALPRKVFSFPPYDYSAVHHDAARLEIVGIPFDVLMRDVVSEGGKFSGCL